MQFGLQKPIFTFDYRGDDTSQIIDSLKKLATTAENNGFDSFWVMDHFHQIPMIGKVEEPMLESWTTLSVVAGLTTKIKLGTLVTGIMYRYPAILAKVAATLDVLSKGRLFMGIGAAWNEEESNAYGIHFPAASERMSRLEEAIQIIRKMWTEEPSASFNGIYYQIRNAYCNPKPIQKPSPPILVGGSGERKTLKIVAKYADACNLFGSAETVKRKLNILKEHCKSVGRDYNSILKTKLSIIVVEDEKQTSEKKIEQIFKGMPEEQIREFAIHGTPEEVLRQIESFEQVGIQYLIVDLDPTRELEALDVFANKIIKKF
ncbi:MAG: TIGR03560 family F420-dependent LLM class oxidoreductase [Nitrososphaeraceae archaeon]|nr:TIGR03560 family F420-dependent LLM class oxidoreductase [Nitrososphaeraceae archaeon]MDW0198008.1 TIGR03560 family F420-dependent LLM class oxidoreductase [Nitrososphaeraceae archaeon]MDW0203561.1 TIGR03560 family F420-dependent LLM class oxidoreductase [Nitrososphaeraceae archaeon]MDW0214477.1 TIGR03560 family F420-dependent LLM class oxidoreductase [Nitrososphaeraceae archaeon]MDW0278580.1 TIGR03560 family F420-dependent LLM class oxidoreductase [Nitrososphaeraceae archaeon]